MRGPYSPAEIADAQRDAAALIGAQARGDELAAETILDHGDPIGIAMVLAGSVCALVTAAGDDPASWAARVLAALEWKAGQPAPLAPAPKLEG